ncbi:hypothetical protein PJL18_04073 [Paenarthrobacter nicotinovorans]|nr:hypothetical protein [Paenarthrobacter nicotinovorans]
MPLFLGRHPWDHEERSISNKSTYWLTLSGLLATSVPHRELEQVPGVAP